MFGYGYGDGEDYDQDPIETKKYMHNRYYYNENPTDVEELSKRKQMQKALYEAMLISTYTSKSANQLSDYDAMLLGLK